MRTSLAIVVLAAALLAGTALRADAIRHKHQLEHDEAITYLAATGHEGAYNAAMADLGGRWVAAASWKDLVTPGPFLVFERIAADLAHFDNHPPLYFWLLHVWVAFFGVSARSGPVLNVIIAALTCLALFGFARCLLDDALDAAVVALTWAVAAPVIETSLMARHYDLFALVTVLFAWQLVRVTDPGRPTPTLDLVLLSLLTGAGLLTHYQFALVVVAGAALALVRLWGAGRRRLLWAVAAAAGGVALFVALDPLFYLSIERQRAQQAHGFDFPGSSQRWWTVERGLSESLGHGGIRPAVLALVALALVAAAAVAFAIPASRRFLVRNLRATDRGGLIALYFLVVVGGLTTLLYVTGQSPTFGMHGRYLAALWPFLAFAPLVVCRLFGRYGAAVALAFCLLVVLPGGMLYVRSYESPLPNVTALAGARRVLVDTVVRGTLPRDLWYVPASTRVFAARQSSVLAQPERWLPQLAAGDLYIAADGLNVSKEDRAAIVSRLSNQFAVSFLHGHPYGSARLVALDAASGGPR